MRFFQSISADNEILIVKTPPFAESITEGDIRWNDGIGNELGKFFSIARLIDSSIGPGKAVEEDEQLADIETDKVTKATKTTLRDWLIN